MTTRLISAAATALALALTPAGAATAATDISLQEFRVPEAAMEEIRGRWIDRLVASGGANTWAPMRIDLTESDLAAMGLPPRDVLSARRYPEPTMVSRDGKRERVNLGSALVSLAGAGWFGIRPGAWLLLIDDSGIGWCSMAHVYGSPGEYQISTAGHCGRVGQTATVIAAFGNRDGALNPVLLDFGTFTTSRDGGLGNDWALISIDPAYQHLVSPTMPFWGGPRGVFTGTGAVASLSFAGGIRPSAEVTPDPTLAQTIVHYGHGIGLGTGGTPRAGEAIHWAADHYMFFGAISPGDSGSGANAVVGDASSTMQAGGIMTHLWIDPLMRSGLGVMAGTRSTKIAAPLENGQLVPYPAPAPGLP